MNNWQTAVMAVLISLPAFSEGQEQKNRRSGR